MKHMKFRDNFERENYKVDDIYYNIDKDTFKKDLNSFLDSSDDESFEDETDFMLDDALSEDSIFLDSSDDELDVISPNMNYNEFYHMVKIINSTENVSDKPFWETPEFDESNFEIIDNEIRLNEGILINNEAKTFFLSYLKPLVDRYLANHIPEENEYGDDNSYIRAMSLMK